MLTRALGLKKHNITIGISVKEKYNLAGSSRYCGDKLKYPDPSNKDDFINWLFSILKERTFDCLITPYEQTTYWVSKYKKRLSKLVGVSVPDFEILDIAFDKWKSTLIARDIGIPVPKSRIIERQELKNIDEISDEFVYPLFLKARYTNYFNGDRFLKGDFARINNKKDLIKYYPLFHKDIPNPIIQNYFPGYQLNVSTVCQEGEPKIAFIHRGIRTAGLTAAATAVRVSEKFNRELVEQTFNLLKAMKWHGPAEVEYRVDSKNNVPYLIEVNGRIWQGIGFGMQCGVDFSEYIIKICNNEKIITQNNYKVGEKSRWLLGDFINLGAVLLKTKEPDNIRRLLIKLKAVLIFILDFVRIKNYDILSITDPWPSVYQIGPFINKVKLLLFREK